MFVVRMTESFKSYIISLVCHSVINVKIIELANQITVIWGLLFTEAEHKFQRGKERGKIMEMCKMPII